ncbi:hypothetical protein HMPREF1210_01701 [Paenisporosarcina sp. HGH0030]|uniref:glycosyltransferase n=1 Tax=Paenisporosarcina sp. HGH0030 TaxID=1078085 RepID=UPI00034EC7CA|nr:glycosyltransferase [Paenisporosarcina sp. HGH0030]EPD52348.1 hypothetical protein HMPREF1210_01701 [Paenisporosarcina sp. HGH0030]
MKPVFSIIVPVYKVEKYLSRCVESLINQTFENIEIILVNDGSPDSCPQICDNYAVKDSRIKTIHKENGGLSDARNFGLRQAHGDYLFFVDSDDYIELDTCEQFLSVLGSNNPDIVVGNAKRIENESVKLMQHQFFNNSQIVTGEYYLKKELKSGTMYMTAWQNLYNKEFLINNKLEFKYGLLHEDEQFTPRVFLKAEKVIATDIVFYNYMIREDSITTVKNKIKNAEHIMLICEELQKIYSEIENVDLKLLLNDNLVNKYLTTFQVASLHKSEYSYLVNNNFLNNKAYTIKNKLRVLLFKLNKKLYYNINNFSKKLKN